MNYYSSPLMRRSSGSLINFKTVRFSGSQMVPIIYPFARVCHIVIVPNGIPIGGQIVIFYISPNIVSVWLNLYGNAVTYNRIVLNRCRDPLNIYCVCTAVYGLDVIAFYHSATNVGPRGRISSDYFQGFFVNMQFYSVILKY